MLQAAPAPSCHACALSCALVRLERFGRKSEMCRRRGRDGFAFEASETRELTVSLTRVLLVMAVMEVISTPYTCRPATHPVTGALGRETTSSKVPSVPQTAATSTPPAPPRRRCATLSGRASTDVPGPARHLICRGQSLATVGQAGGDAALGVRAEQREQAGTWKASLSTVSVLASNQKCTTYRERD